MHIPETLRRFVERQTTMPVADLQDSDREEPRSPYGSYWYRAVACIRGRALVEPVVGQIFYDCTRLPQDDLVRAAEGPGLAVDGVDVAGWQMKLDARGRKALVAALYTAEWAYYAEHEKTGWWFAS